MRVIAIDDHICGLPRRSHRDVIYIGQSDHAGDLMHNFMVPDRFNFGIPDYLIGTDFLFEPI